MKRTKKLLALALALMTAFSCMAMPAMAAGDEFCDPADNTENNEINPRAKVCACGALARYLLGAYNTQVPCPQNPRNAHHTTAYTGKVMYCDECEKYIGYDKSHTSAVVACDNWQSGPCFSPYYLWTNY